MRLSLAGTIAAYCIMATASQAASVSGFLQTGIGSEFELDSFGGALPLYEVERELSVTGGSARSTATVDTDTGEISLSAEYAIEDPSLADPNAAIGMSRAVVQEDFVLNGTGSLILHFALDATWDFVDGGILAALSGSSSSTGDLQALFSRGPGTGGVDDELLSITFDYVDAVNEEAYASWFIEIFVRPSDGLASTGFVDATRTGTIFFETTGTLSATPSSADFLKDAIFPEDIGGDVPAVPVPASGLLLLLGTLALGLRRRLPGYNSTKQA